MELNPNAISDYKVPKIFQCPHDNCRNTFDIKSYLNRHITKFHMSSEIECNLCKTKFSNERSIKSHNYKFHKKKGIIKNELFECPQKCGKIYPTKSAIVSHTILAHIPRKDWPFECPFCGLKISNKGDKARHMALVNHKDHAGVTMPKVGSEAWNALLNQSSLKIKIEKSLPVIKDETELPVLNVKKENESPTIKEDSKNDPVEINKPSNDPTEDDHSVTEANIKKEGTIENGNVRDENNDALSAIVDRIDNNENITIDEMLLAIEKICGP